MLRELRWTVWHPHQKLWNWSLVDAVNTFLRGGLAARGGVRFIVAADTAILVARAAVRRLRHLRLAALSDAGASLVFVDCGTHKEGVETRWMHRWFGDRLDLRTFAFEASSEHFRDARAALADIPTVELQHLALVGPGASSMVRLYDAAGNGREDSLFSSRGERYEEVPACRLSAFLAERGICLERQPVILRMNIEGAEKYVIDDLAEAGALELVDGYYGMWDDLSKIDPDLDREFRRFLRRRRISPFTFNERDLQWPLRRFAIRFDIETSIRAALTRKS